MKKFNYLKIDIKTRNYFKSYDKAAAYESLKYWSAKYPDGFHKFKFPCKHPLYKKDDSWSESLGLTKRKLESAFSGLVNHHKSKNAYRNSQDKFAGKMFCSYTERNTNRTFYFMDKEAVDKFEASLSIPPISSPSPISRLEESLAPKTPINTHSETSRGAHIGSPLVRARQQPLSLSTHTITSLSEEKLIAKEMIDIWNSQMANQQIWYPSTAAKLYEILQTWFKGCLENFKTYCKDLASSAFLTGKAPNSSFRAFFYWAIKPHNIQMIFQGAYGVKSLFSMLTPEINNAENDVLRIDAKLKRIDEGLETYQKPIRHRDNPLVKQKIKTLSKETLDEISGDSERDYYQTNPTIERINDIWGKRALNAHYDRFLELWCAKELGLSDSIVVPAELLDEKKSLERERALAQSKLDELRANKRGLKDLILFPI